MLRQLIIVGLIFVASLAQAGEAGRIVFATGKVHVADHAVVLGDAIQEGDVLATGADGYAYLKTIDSGFLILRPNSRARITAYRVDQQYPTKTQVKLELLSGVARSISGQAVKQARQYFRFNTPVAAIGVRGTDFTVYTDQQTTRVTVISGGIVVSGFEGACKPEGMGPCEGGSSRELFANQADHQLLQIQKGQAAPKLLHGNVPAPDLVAPPRSDEPIGKTFGPASAPLVSEVNLDSQKSKVLLTTENLPPPVVPPPPVVVPPPPVVEPPPVVVVTPPTLPPVVELPRSPPEVLWGRWEAVAGLAPDSEVLAKLKNGTYDPAKVLGSFAIARLSKTELVLPQQGRASFGLVGSEAYITATGKTPVAATIQDAQLDIDFATRGFTTSLTVVAPDAQVDVHAQGGVTLKGELVANLSHSNVSIVGYLGDAAAREAGYIFKSTDAPALSAFGATRWSR